ncbi:unnamed protein product [Ophioblennius macclurei]
MSLTHRVSQHFSRNGHTRLSRGTFGQGLFAERRATCPTQRLVILTLGLFNVVLLLAAAVIGIYCAKANDFQMSDLGVSSVIVEMNNLRNNTEIIRAKEEAERALAKEREAHLLLKKQMKEGFTGSDSIQKIIETLAKEREILQANKTALEESCGRCPPGWELVKSHCYYATSHERFLRKNWNDSRADCIRQGSDLAVIDDMGEQFELTRKIWKGRRGPVMTHWRDSGFWVGLTKPQPNGVWAWIDNKLMNSTQWKTGEPSVVGLWVGNCGAILFQNHRQKSLYNTDCQKPLNSICKMEQKRM